MRIKETIPSKLEIVPDSIAKLIERLHDLPLDEDVIFSVKLCLQEAVVNAVKHGNKFNEKLKVQIVISVEDGHLDLAVTDQGTGFVPKEIPDPTTPENIAKLSGRGIFLIKKNMNKVRFANGGRTIRMTKILTKGRKSNWISKPKKSTM